MRKKWWSLMLLMALLVYLPMKASAAEDSGSVRVTLKRGGGEVTLYRVGEPAEGGYRLRETYGGGFIQYTDANSPALAQWLAETGEEAGVHRLLDADRTACFSDLKEGLYLLEQTQSRSGYYPFRPFLVQIPYDGLWHLSAEPKNTIIQTESPATGQGMEPFVGLLGILLSGTGLILCGKKAWKR